MQNQLNILIVIFKNEITKEELPLFRGAIINLVKDSPSLLYHNHIDNKLRYQYPLIQYKRIRQKAAVVCVGEGSKEIGELFNNFRPSIRIGNRKLELDVEQIKVSRPIVQVSDRPFDYHIRNWLPLNSENYKKIEQLDGLVDRTKFLENIMTANMLSFCKGVGIRLDKQVSCKILQIDEQQLATYKGVRLLSIGGVFRSNLSIPDYVGIGKGVSLGHGTVVRRHSVEEKKLSRQRKVFLLGGHDLEMLAIKEILYSQPNCVVVDKNLQWDNAKLSAYFDELQEYADDEIYGIELAEDISLPEELKANYRRIDHHNDMNGLPSSLEQTAAVLGMDLNRRQRLIAANDSGYIPAMRALGAMDEEVTEIRRLDRAVQGVTEDDERLAEKSINENKNQYGSLVVVKSLTSKFSPICDRLYPYESLLVYTDEEWMFYGKGKADLVKHFSEEIEKKSIFHGGGEYGYIGSVKNAYEKGIIHTFANQIKNQYVGH